MAEPQLLPNRVWTPRLLAVVSCALALLAAQPLSASPSAKARNAPIVKDGGSHARPLHVIESAPNATARVTKAPREETLFASARRLHILATVEILQRLLAAELQPAERHLIAGLSFEPILLGTLDLPIVATAGTLFEFHPLHLPPPPEQAFAIEHCLLAPPLS